MPMLTLKFKGNTIKTYTLKKGDSLTIGRRNTNDIVIENLAVSGSHAKVDSVEDGFLITDLQSKNGSFVNDQLFTSHFLNHGDIVTIGKHILEFTYGEGEIRPQKKMSIGMMDQTMVMDTEKQREMLATADAEKVPASLQSGPVGVLTFLSGGNGEVVLTKKLTKIGKASDADIVVSGMLVGKNAATISNRPKGYYISFVGGITRPKINDKPIKNSVKLEEFDMIQIGTTKMQFVYKK